eukprot:TRINITY_DN78833_c0_g1_i1.p1 TRINITY_DN78833_c0_g1~~TRINITY_DN78833_c0_g1_i1.p1  ORF type:complete len:282 (-),score=32.49 TRINITY_DN78833_c0_g1_i1:263-1066(-)
MATCSSVIHFIFHAFLFLHVWGVMASTLRANTSVSSHQGNPERQCPSPNAPVTSIQDLSSQYCNIFQTGNRNAASFRWFKFLADRASSKSESEFLALNKGYCPISGSPIPGTQSGKVTLKKVGGGTETGLFHFCCWPCLCDMIDLVRVDTKSISRSGGSSNLRVLVIGDPCTNASQLTEPFSDPFGRGSQITLENAAPEVTCSGSKVNEAVFSDGGHPIIGILYTDAGSATIEADDMVTQCSERADAGFNSGMGLIFRKVAEISPLE